MSRQPELYEDLITDLIYLRKGDGFTITKARNASTFLEVMGGAGQTFEELTTRFISAIYSLEEERSVEALLVAYGLKPGYEEKDSIFERRKKYGQKIGRMYDTLVDREQTAIQELAIRMLMAKWVNAPLPANIPVIHGVFITEYLNAVSIIRDRTLIETRETQKFIALADGVESYDYSTNEPSDIISIEGCEVESHLINLGMKYVLRFPKPLQRGQTHKISFIELSPKQGKYGKKAIAMELARSFAIPTFIFNQEIEFIGQKPRVIWSYSMLSLLERPSRPEEQKPLRFEDGESIIRVSFTHLHGGMFSGVAWQW